MYSVSKYSEKHVIPVFGVTLLPKGNVSWRFHRNPRALPKGDVVSCGFHAPLLACQKFYSSVCLCIAMKGGKWMSSFFFEQVPLESGGCANLIFYEIRPAEVPFLSNGFSPPAICDYFTEPPCAMLCMPLQLCAPCTSALYHSMPVRLCIVAQCGWWGSVARTRVLQVVKYNHVRVRVQRIMPALYSAFISPLQHYGIGQCLMSIIA